MAGIGEVGVRVGADISEFTAGMNRTQQIAETSMRRVEQAQRIAQQAADKFTASLQYQVDTFGKSDAEILRHKANLLGASSAAEPLIARLEALRASAPVAAGGIRTAAHEMEGLSFASAGAKRELLVLAHELSQGNFKRFGGSLMVIGEQTGAAGLLFSAAGLGALGLAAGIGLVAAAAIKGAKDQREMSNALIETGYYAGVTGDKLNSMAHDAVMMGGSISEAKKAVIDLAGSGKFTGQEIGKIADAAIAMEHATGKAVDETIKQFESLAVQTSGNTMRATEAISKAALKLDDQYHFLTESVYENIRAFEKDGDQKAASALAIDALAKTTKERAEEMAANIGYVARAWNLVKEVVGDVGDAIGNAGKKSTAGQQVAEIQRLLQNPNNIPGVYNNATRDAAVANLKGQLAIAQAAMDQANKAAADKAAEAAKQSEGAHAASRVIQDDTRLERKGYSELQVAIREYGEDLSKIAAANPKSPLLNQNAVNSHMAALMKAHEITAKILKDDPTQNYLAASLKQTDGLIARESALFKSREQSIARAVASEYITTAEGLKEKRQAIADDYAATQALYAKEAAEVAARKAKLNPATEKKAMAEQDKMLAEIEAKRALAAQASSAAMMRATGDQFKIQNDFNRSTAEWVRQQGLANDAMQFSIDIMGTSALEAAKLTNARQIYLQTEEKIRLALLQDKNSDVSGLRAAGERQVAIANALLEARDAKQADPWFNAAESIRKYGAEADNVGAQIGSAMTNAFKGAEDAFVQFVTTGKLSFSSLATSILADLARIEIRKAEAGLISMAASALGDYFGPSTIGTVGAGHAGGGPVSPGGLYPVNELGPELLSSGGRDYLMMGNQGGTITPNNKLGAMIHPSAGASGGGIQVNTNITLSDHGARSETSGDSSATGRALADMVNSQVKFVLTRELRQGGILWSQQMRGSP